MTGARRTSLLVAGAALAVALVAGTATAGLPDLQRALGLDDAASDGASETAAGRGAGSGAASPGYDGGESGDGSLSGSGYGEDEDLRAIEQLLERRAEAIVEGDEEAFRATLDDADPAFVDQQLTSYRNLRLLGVERVVYGETGDLLPVTPVSGDDPEIKPELIEHVQLRSDVGMVSNAVGFTFVERDGTWLLGAERIDETERLLSSIGPSRLWAEGPIEVRREGRLTVVVDRDRADALPDLTARAARALAFVRELVGDGPPGPLLVDATSSGTATRLSDQGLTVAGAVFGPAITTALDSLDPVGVGGWRIKYNPDELDTTLSDDRVLRHELTHFVLRDDPQPLWLLEGLAEYVSWQRLSLSRLAVPAAVYARLARTVPRDALIGDEQFQRAPATGYLASQALVEELAAREGIDGVLDLVRAYGRERRRGVPDARAQSAALREVFDLSEAELAAAGYARLMRVNHPY